MMHVQSRIVLVLAFVLAFAFPGFAQDQTARVAVPDGPTVGRLTCTYFPSVAGAPTSQFFANRVMAEPR